MNFQEFENEVAEIGRLKTDLTYVHEIEALRSLTNIDELNSLISQAAVLRTQKVEVSPENAHQFLVRSENLETILRLYRECLEIFHRQRIAE